MTKRRIVYIAGPVTTDLSEFNFPAFNAVAEQLRAEGAGVENPAENGSDDTLTYGEYIRLGLRQLLRCNEIMLLPNWEASRGAQLEKLVAETVGMTVTEWAPREASHG
jgi:hypothetical protein